MEFKKLKKLPVSDMTLRHHLDKWLETTFTDPQNKIDFDAVVNDAYRRIVKRCVRGDVAEGSVVAFLEIVANIQMKAGKCDVVDVLQFFLETHVFEVNPKPFTHLLDYLYEDNIRHPDCDNHDYEFMVSSFTRAYFNTKPDTQYAGWVPHINEDKRLVGYN